MPRAKKRPTSERTDLPPIMPMCPACKKSDRVQWLRWQGRVLVSGDPEQGGVGYWCDRCIGWLTSFGFINKRINDDPSADQ